MQGKAGAPWDSSVLRPGHLRSSGSRGGTCAPPEIQMFLQNMPRVSLATGQAPGAGVDKDGFRLQRERHKASDNGGGTGRGGHTGAVCSASLWWHQA